MKPRRYPHPLALAAVLAKDAAAVASILAAPWLALCLLDAILGGNP